MARISIGRAVGRLARQRPDAVAVRCDDDVLTRDALDRASTALARRWVEDGVAVDDLVTVALPNGPDLVVACVAAWKAGATPQPLSPRLPADERRAVLDAARPALVVDRPLPRPWPTDPAGAPPLPDRYASSWKAPTSSGSTGRPKIVRASAPALVDPDGEVAAFVPREAVQLVAGPLTHAAPFVYAMRGLMTGHELVVMRAFDARAWLRLVEEHRVTWSVLVPAMMQRIRREPTRAATDVSSLRSVLHLGARCPEDLKRDWLDWLGPERVVELYAGTEAQGLALVGGREWLEHPGTVGRAVGGSRFRIERPDGTACEPGETGEVLMRRDRPTYAYLGAPAPGRPDGWHSLGDVGHLDAGGRLYVTDRLDDGVVTDGSTVWPADVEAVLDAHPAVRSSVVVGRPDAELGQRVHAVLDLGDAGGAGDVADPADVVAWAARRLEPEQRPRSWERARSTLRDDTGKVRRGDHR